VFPSSAQLFKPFSQSDSSITRKLDGAGLGFAVARKNAQLMGDDVLVESAPGPDSTFTLHLPLESENIQNVRVPPVATVSRNN
jgi:signal transduction histidine kinase